LDNIILKAENLVKIYGTEDGRRRVLDGVSLTVRKGEFVSIMGPSGSGKSTLLFALSGTDAADEGTVRLAGRDLSGLGEKELADLRRTAIGFVFQQPMMLPNLNILDNILLPAARGNRKNMKALTERARYLMQRTGIAGLERRSIGQVSGGQLQRAAICRALINRPQIVFGDEPTGALHSGAAQDVMDLLAEINKEGTSILLVTHDLHVAARTGRVLFMRDGSLAGELRLPEFRRTEMADRAKAVAEMTERLGFAGHAG
jgi:putative ABC transport system ATP-binding protein